MCSESRCLARRTQRNATAGDERIDETTYNTLIGDSEMKYDELKARLSRTHLSMAGGFKRRVYLNPDGPAAIAAIEELEARVRELEQS